MALLLHSGRHAYILLSTVLVLDLSTQRTVQDMLSQILEIC